MQQVLRGDPVAGPKEPRPLRQVPRVDRVLHERLDGRHEDACPSRSPGGEGGHPGRCLVRHQLAALVGERSPRLQHGNGRRIAEPGLQLLGDPVPDLGVARDPHEPLPGGPTGERRREERLRAVGHVREPGVTTGDGRRLARRSQSLAQRIERAALVQKHRQSREIRQPPAGSGRLPIGPARAGRRLRGLRAGVSGDRCAGARRAFLVRRAPGVLQYGVHLGFVQTLSEGGHAFVGAALHERAQHVGWHRPDIAGVVQRWSVGYAVALANAAVTSSAVALIELFALDESIGAGRRALAGKQGGKEHQPDEKASTRQDEHQRQAA